MSKDVNFDAPCGGFDSFSSLRLFLFLETMYFELLFEVDVLFNSQDGEDVVNLPLLGQLDGLCMCLQWRSYETSVEKTTQICGGYG